MTCDRYVILTDITKRDHAVLAQWGVTPCDLAMLAKQTIAIQEAVMAAFTEYAAKPGKANLMEPTLPPVPSPLDQTALEAGSPQQLTLAVANPVMRTWTAWLATERERVKRWTSTCRVGVRVRHLPRSRLSSCSRTLSSQSYGRWCREPRLHGHRWRDRQFLPGAHRARSAWSRCVMAGSCMSLAR